jgi:hypothetical protein
VIWIGTEEGNHAAIELGVERQVSARLAATGLAFGHFAMLTQWAAEGAPGDLQQRSDQLVRDIRGQLPTAVLSS